ncbi:MAG: hypothetical protein Kow0031_23920 [Anaerolineae bacterium]
MTQEQENSESRGSSGGDRRRSFGGGDRRPNRGPGGPGGRRSRFQPRRKVCLYCAEKERVIDWKNVNDLRRFIGDSGSIFPRRKTGMCARHQRAVAVAIKRARHIALLPYTSEHVRITGQGRG